MAMKKYYPILLQYEDLSAFRQRRILFELILLKAKIEKKELTLGDFIKKSAIYNELFKATEDQASWLFVEIFTSASPESIATWTIPDEPGPEGKFDRSDPIITECNHEFMGNWARDMGHFEEPKFENIPGDITEEMLKMLTAEIDREIKLLKDFDYSS